MYRLTIKDEKNRYELTELAKMFVSADELDTFADASDSFDVRSEGIALAVFPRVAFSASAVVKICVHGGAVFVGIRDF